MIIQKSKSTLVTIIIHVLIWMVFGMIYFFQPITWNITLPYQLWIKQSIILGLVIIAYYINSVELVPRFLLKDRNGIYFVIVISITIFIVVMSGYLDQWLNLRQLMDAAFHRGQPHHRGGGGGKGRGPDVGMMAALGATVALVLGVGTSIMVIQKWQKDRQVHQEMEQDKISSELSFLKAQINPHFFFNTLNNIYALTHVNAETSRSAIHQLSRMMRYVLYDTQNSTTQLSQEIAFIKDYISLMQLRLTDVVKIDFRSPALVKDMAVAPMIFLPFVENAFKHGVSATYPSHIEISIEQRENTLELKVVNTIINEQSNNLEEASGIGLNNTRRRLDLLYPGKYTLLINEDTEENVYLVHLTLDLS